MELFIDRPKQFKFKRSSSSDERIYQGGDRMPLGQMPIHYEPKRQNRFILEFPTEMGIQVWMVRGVTKPSYSIDLHGGHWNDVVVELYDPIGPSTSRIMYEWLMGNNNNGNLFFTLSSLDPTGVIVEKWQIIGNIVSYDFGEYNMADDGVCYIQIVIHPTTCLLEF